MPQLDTRGINARIGTMQGINAVGQQQRTKNLQSRNLLMQEQIGQLPEQREREGVLWERGTEEYEQKKKESDLNYKELIKGIKDKDRKRLIEQKKDIAVRLLRVNPGDISTWQKEWDMLTAENPEMVKGLESMGLSRDQITPETHEDLKDIVLGELKVLTDHQAEEKSKLEAQKIKGRSDLQAQADRAAGKRAKVTGPGKGTKEDPRLKEFRADRQDMIKKIASAKLGEHQIPGFANIPRDQAIKMLEDELKKIESDIAQLSGNVAAKPKPSTNEGYSAVYVYDEEGNLIRQKQAAPKPQGSRETKSEKKTPQDTDADKRSQIKNYLSEERQAKSGRRSVGNAIKRERKKNPTTIKEGSVMDFKKQKRSPND